MIHDARHIPGARSGPRILALLTAMAISLSASASYALTCPVAHPTGGDGVLKETPATIDRLSAELGRADLSGAQGLIADLRARHPKATDAEIMNFLITAYCPAVSHRTDLSDAQKRAEMNRVSGAVSKLLFSRASR